MSRLWVAANTSRVMLRTKNNVNVHPVIAVVSRGTVTPITTAVTGISGTNRAAVTGDLVTVSTRRGVQHPARALSALIAKPDGITAVARIRAAEAFKIKRTSSRSIPVRLGATDARMGIIIVFPDLQAATRTVTPRRSSRRTTMRYSQRRKLSISVLKSNTAKPAAATV